jgi:hypothetical protein
MYEFGRKAGDREVMNLARELFNAAKRGKVGSAIIKSGLAMDAYAKFNSEDVENFFKTAKWLFD